MFDRRTLTSDGVGRLSINLKVILLLFFVSSGHLTSAVFGSSADDGLLNSWDYEKVGNQEEAGSKSPNIPPGLVFQHAGHRDKVVDFHWNAHDPWTIVSASDDGEFSGGGGTLQLWRMIDLLYRPKDEVLNFNGSRIKSLSAPRLDKTQHSRVM